MIPMIFKKLKNRLISKNIETRKIMRSLTESEEIVMKSVWELGGNCTLSQIVKQCAEHDKVWQLQTVATFLKHLEAKGYVRPYKDGRFLHYEVLVHEKDYKKSAFRKFLNFWNKGKVENFACDLYKDEILSDKEIEKIKEILDEFDD
jgi:predicted transcriptional regulator